MERKVLDQILNKLDISENDIRSIGETWMVEDLAQINMQGTVRGQYQYYDLVLKSGRRHYLKRHHLTGIIKSVEDIGYRFL